MKPGAIAAAFSNEAADADVLHRNDSGGVKRGKAAMAMLQRGKMMASFPAFFGPRAGAFRCEAPNPAMFPAMFCAPYFVLSFIETVIG